MNGTYMEYEIEAQRIGVPQSRWNVSDPMLPCATKGLAEHLCREWAGTHPDFQYRVVEFERRATGNKGDWFHTRESEQPHA